MTDWLTDAPIALGMDNPNAYLAGLKSRRATILARCMVEDDWSDETEPLRDDWQDMTPVLYAERPGTTDPGIMFRPADNGAFQAALTANLALLEAAEA